LNQGKNIQTIIKPDLGKKPYRLKCRFAIDAYPHPDWLTKEAKKIAEQFVRDMKAQGWEHVPEYQFKIDGPFPKVTPMTVKQVRQPTAREMLPYILQGATFPDKGGTMAQDLLPLDQQEYWEFELSAVFFRETLLVEYPDPHEEIK